MGKNFSLLKWILEITSSVKVGSFQLRSRQTIPVKVFTLFAISEGLIFGRFHDTFSREVCKSFLRSELRPVRFIQRLSLYYFKMKCHHRLFQIFVLIDISIIFQESGRKRLSFWDALSKWIFLWITMGQEIAKFQIPQQT